MVDLHNCDSSGESGDMEFQKNDAISVKRINLIHLYVQLNILFNWSHTCLNHIDIVSLQVYVSAVSYANKHMDLFLPNETFAFQEFKGDV